MLLPVDELELFIWPDVPIWSASVITGTTARGEMEVQYSFATGTSVAPVAGMTLVINNIGESSRGVDYQRLRTTPSGGVIGVPENSIVWVAGQQLQILKTFEVWGVAPRNVVSNGIPIFYKDYDISYTNQNRFQNPVPCIGPNQALHVDDRVYYTATGSWDPQNDTITGYSWTFEGGTPSSSSAATPGYVRYSIPGYYITSCVVTNSAGKTGTARRHVYVGEPTKPWILESLVGDSSGGYSAKVTIKGTAPSIRGGTIVIIRSKRPIRSGAHPNIFFTGYISGKSIRVKPFSNETSFDVTSVNGLQDHLDVFGACTMHDASPDTWWKVYNQTVDKAVCSYLQWHTTLLTVADFHGSGDATPVKNVDIARGGSFAPLRELYFATLQMNVINDAQGGLWCIPEPSLLPVGSRPTGTYLDITQYQWRDELNVVTQPIEPCSYVEVGGVAYTGATGTTDAFLSGAPATVPGQYGKVDKSITSAVLSSVGSQAQLNVLAGHYYAWKTNRYREVHIPMVGCFADLDLNMQLWSTIDTKNVIGDLETRRLYLKRLEHAYKPRSKALVTSFVFEPETYGPPGVTVEIPPPVPSNPYVPPPRPVVPPPEAGPRVVVLLVHKTGVSTGHLLRTTSFDTETPTWTHTLDNVFISKLWQTDINIKGAIVIDAPDPSNIYRITNLRTTYPAQSYTLLYRTTPLYKAPGCDDINLTVTHNEMIRCHPLDYRKVLIATGIPLSGYCRHSTSQNAGLTWVRASWDYGPPETFYYGNFQDGPLTVGGDPNDINMWKVIAQCGWTGPWYRYRLYGNGDNGGRTLICSTPLSSEWGEEIATQGLKDASALYVALSWGGGHSWYSNYIHTNNLIATPFDDMAYGVCYFGDAVMAVKANQLYKSSGGGFTTRGTSSLMLNLTSISAMTRSDPNQWVIGGAGTYVTNHNIIKVTANGGGEDSDWVPRIGDLWEVMLSEGIITSYADTVTIDRIFVEVR